MLPSLPPAITAPAPFPLVTWTSLVTEFVAPGVTRGEYRLLTSSGPLHITVVGVDTHEPTIKIGAVLASDHVISHGETVSAMAARTGAVAGINADYFDIGQTNQPLNIVAQNGLLERSPSSRATLTVTQSGEARFGTYRFAGSVQTATGTTPLDGVNTWGPHGGATLFTARYGGALPATATIATLTPVTPGDDGLSGTYTVASVAPSDRSLPAGPVLAFNGPAKVQGGDQITLSLQTDPPLVPGASAIGGGPLLVAGGEAVDDVDAPAPEEASLRFPVAGVATRADGTLLLIAVDGRLPESSVGLTRPELGALMLALGARDGMATDSGGSATLVARILGEVQPRVLNTPSDGKERPVADGLFVYSTAPAGPISRLVVRPSSVRALGNVAVVLHLAETDAAGHALATLPDSSIETPARVGTASIPIVRDGIEADLPVQTVATLDRLTLEPARPNPDPGATIVFAPLGADQHGQPVALGARVAWSASGGTIDGGTFHAGSHDATVTARAGGAIARLLVRVGRHTEPVALFAPPSGGRLRFVTIPPNGPGSLVAEAPCACVRLSYDFTAAERAAYAAAESVLPEAAVGFGLDVQGDANGEALRATLVDRDGRLARVTLAQTVTWTGWQPVRVGIPPELLPPVKLVSLYALGTLGDAPLHVRGSLAFRAATLLIAGTP
jgi:hypothetical protein